MEALFLKVVNMSITSGYVILAVLVIRLLLRKAPRKYAYLLWSVVGFRLCCPVSFQSVFSLFSLKFFHLAEVQSNGGQTLQYVPENIGLMKQPEVNVGITAVNQVINRSFPSASSMTSVNPMQIWIFLATWIWCVGIVAFFLLQFDFMVSASKTCG
jgi:beta-lactamase regulating signal transducer with metallopeptidase domain